QLGHDVNGERLQRGLSVLDDDGKERRKPGAEHGHRADPAGVIVAVDVLASEGGEKAARLGLPAVEHGRAVTVPAPSPSTAPPTTAAISPRLSGIMTKRRKNERCAVTCSRTLRPPTYRRRIENRIPSGNTWLP